MKANATEEGSARNKARYLFARPSDGRFPLFPVIIAEILAVLGMRVDPATGVNRRAYSCRHYYATQSLYDGVDIGALASNMGTTLRMIDDHYGHVLANRQSGMLTGSGKDRRMALFLQQSPEKIAAANARAAAQINPDADDADPNENFVSAPEEPPPGPSWAAATAPALREPRRHGASRWARLLKRSC